MARRPPASAWAKACGRTMAALTRTALQSGSQAVERALEPARQRRVPPPGTGEWTAGVALGLTGSRRFRLYRPRGLSPRERPPLLVMLHGCGQDARSFALCTRMNRVADRGRFLVLYPEQDRSANAQGCWNWFDTRTGRAHAEAALILRAIDQVCLFHAADRTRVAVAGLSAGASMAALLATRHPERFRAVAMHSGVPPGTASSTLSALGAMHGLHPPRSPHARWGAPAPDRVAWPPLMVIHGADDAVVSHRNAHAAAAAWADAAGANAATARHYRRGERHPVTVTRFRDRHRTVATLVEVEGLGHAWSGGAPRQSHSDARGPDASRMIWAFVARHLAA